MSKKLNKSIKISTEPRLYQAKKSTITPDQVPTMIPEKSQKVLFAGVEEPFFLMEEIPDISIPVFPMGAGGYPVLFSAAFWDSWIVKLNDAPFPGSKDGHQAWFEGGKTPPTDIYVVGALRKGNTVYIKNFIPPMGYTTDNSGLIRDAKVKLVNFSIVSYTKDEIMMDENDYIESITAIESVKGERNDVVPLGLGAMDQKVNKAVKPENNNSEENDKMADDKDILILLQNAIDSGKITFKQLSKKFDFVILTAKEKEEIKELSEIKTLLGDKPMETIKQLQEDIEKSKKDNFESSRSQLMTETFGPLKINVNGKEEDNLSRLAAENVVSTEIVTIEKLKESVEAAKTDPVVLSFSKQTADYTKNPISGISIVEKKETTDNSEYITI